jgi:hypothetical protein
MEATPVEALPQAPLGEVLHTVEQPIELPQQLQQHEQQAAQALPVDKAAAILELKVRHVAIPPAS